MGATRIEWTETVWNPVIGCTKVSPGCTHCCAERMAKRLAGRYGYPADEPFRVTLHPERLREPEHWRKPKMIFVCSMADLFHPDVSEEFIQQVWAEMAMTPRHTFRVLTKRPDRALEVIPRFAARLTARDGSGWPLPNVWIGVSAENQKYADERIPLLLQVPAAVRFVSAEPLLGPISLDRWFGLLPGNEWAECLCGEIDPTDRPCMVCESRRELGQSSGLHWVIAGGESGPGARPVHPDWLRRLRDQCQVAGVPYFFKQWGGWLHESQETEVLPGGQALPVSRFTYDWPDGTYSAKVGKKKPVPVLTAKSGGRCRKQH